MNSPLSGLEPSHPEYGYKRSSATPRPALPAKLVSVRACAFGEEPSAPREFPPRSSRALSSMACIKGRVRLMRAMWDAASCHSASTAPPKGLIELGGREIRRPAAARYSENHGLSGATSLAAISAVGSMPTGGLVSHPFPNARRLPGRLTRPPCGNGDTGGNLVVRQSPRQRATEGRGATKAKLTRLDCTT